MTKSTTMACLAVLTLLAVFYQEPASAGFELKNGMWRFELAGGTAYHSGNRSRTGDKQLVGEIEYEIPQGERCTLGLRLIPLFLYDQDDKGEDTVWGGGVGLVARYYQVPNEYRGWFGELEGAALGHSGKIEGNSATMNFMIGAGVGYQFKSSWHTTLKVRHISNAGLGDNNAGANTVNVAVGYRW